MGWEKSVLYIHPWVRSRFDISDKNGSLLPCTEIIPEPGGALSREEEKAEGWRWDGTIQEHPPVYLICLSVCPFVSKNVEMAEPIGPKFCVGPCMTPGKVYGCSILQKFVSKSFGFLLNFENARKNVI